MPGNPAAKSQRIDKLVDRFAAIATDFDSLLPDIYRFNGQKPGRDRRANAWARVDQHVILLNDALRELQDVLRKHAARSSTAYCKAESAATDEVEISG